MRIREKHWAGPGGGAELLSIALPLVVSHACETVMMFTDRLFLARLSPAHMSASMSGGLTCFMLMTFFIGLTGYANALVAQRLGAGQGRSAPRVITQALFVSLLSYPLVLACIPVGHGLFRIAGLAPEQLQHQRVYFDILMIGSVFGLLRNSVVCFFSGIGRTRVIMIAALTSMVVNVGANYLLIFGHGGFPAMGMRGAAYGTLIGGAVGLLVVGAAYFSRDNRAEFDVMGALRWDRSIMAQLLRLGYPAGLELFLNLLAFNTLVLAFHACGLRVATAITITFNWDMVAFVPLIGVSIAVTSLVGRYLGARNMACAHRSTLSGLKLCSFYTAILFIAFGGFAGPLVDVFRPAGGNGDFDAVRPLAVFMVRLISIYLFSDALVVVFSGALRGAGDTFWTMCLSVSTHWVLAGLAVAMLHRNVSAATTWVVLVFTFLGLGAVYYARYRFGNWRNRLDALVPVSSPGAGA